MTVCAVILAAGRSQRFGEDKLSQILNGIVLWKHSFNTFKTHPEVDAVGVVGKPAEGAHFVVQGGKTRQESARAGVAAAEGFDIVLIHDAARPYIDHDTISRVIEAVKQHAAAAPAVPVTDTIREGAILLDRTQLVAMQTPQGARRELFLKAHQMAKETYTDDMALLESIGIQPQIVEGNPKNIKVTHPSDLAPSPQPLTPVPRTGIGYDIHSFSEDPAKPLILGGELFQGHKGLEGHSDADVLLHAITDALLGAASLGDIGQHFPNDDPQWKNQPSTIFLRHAAMLLRDNKWRIVNIDATVIAETPKIMLRAELIRGHIARAVEMDASAVSIKATTNEGLGSIGRGEGIAAFAIATIAPA